MLELEPAGVFRVAMGVAIGGPWIGTALRGCDCCTLGLEEPQCGTLLRRYLDRGGLSVGWTICDADAGPFYAGLITSRRSIPVLSSFQVP